jgi:hypothetical protein
MKPEWPIDAHMSRMQDALTRVGDQPSLARAIAGAMDRELTRLAAENANLRASHTELLAAAKVVVVRADYRALDSGDVIDLRAAIAKAEELAP